MDEQNTPTGGLTQATPDQILLGKPVALGKETKIKLPVQPTQGVMPSSVLEDMERLYQEKLAARSPFQDWIKDVLAWGGTEKPGTTLETVRKRAEEKGGQEAELFNMRAQIAAARAQQAQQARQDQYLQSLVGTEGQAAPGTASPGVGAERLPPHVAIAVREKRNLGDNAGALKVIDDYRKGVITEETKFITNPASYQNNIPIVRLDGRPDEVNAIEARRLFEAGLAFPAPSGTAAAPTAPRATPAPAAPAPAAPAPAAPAPAAAGDIYRYENLTPQQLAGLEKAMTSMGINPRDVLRREGAAEYFNSKSPEMRQRLFAAAQEFAAPAPAAPAPAAPAPAAPAVRPTIPEARAQMEEQKKERERMAEAQGKQFDTFLTSIDPPVAADRAATAREAIDVTTKNPRVVGILQSAGVGPAIATLFRSGVSVTGGHSIGMKDIDEAIFRARPGTKPEDIEARERLSTLLEKTAFHLSNIIKGQGQVTEFERVLLQKVAGSLQTTPENIIKIQKSLLARAELDQKLGEMFNNRPQGMTYSKFKGTTEYINAVKAYENQLREIEKEKVSFPKPVPAGTPKSGTAPGGIKWKVLP